MSEERREGGAAEKTESVCWKYGSGSSNIPGWTDQLARGERQTQERKPRLDDCKTRAHTRTHTRIENTHINLLVRQGGWLPSAAKNLVGGGGWKKGWNTDRRRKRGEGQEEKGGGGVIIRHRFSLKLWTLFFWKSRFLQDKQVGRDGKVPTA